tara:strand:+ start:462 stop:1046 length:585 start_codon:yes stop_codon:yes gene_type:complete
MDNAVIYDFETLSQDQINGVVTCLAVLKFDESRFVEKPYTFKELVNSAKVMKFSVEEQVKTYKRKIDKSTLEWWKEQGDDAQKWIKPSDDDRGLEELYDFFMKAAGGDATKFYTRGNTFDPILLESIMKQTHKPMPYNWWEVRDTRSLIEGLSWGSKLENKFIPPDCDDLVKHNPTHDIALDVMRIQALAQAIQ